MLKRCWFDYGALTELFSEASRWRLRETGGALLGWRDGGDVVVRRILGPGPNARHGFSHFEPDHDWQGEEGRRIYDASKRTVAYVGDWHTHPRGAPRPSAQDRKTMAAIANDKDFRSPQPLSLILGRSRFRRRRELHVYIWNGTALEPIKVELFDAVDRGAQAG